MGPRRVKLRLAEVAAQAEVSEATVSRVLNNKPGVSESTRASVLTAIDVLGFEVPERLRPRVGALIGLITPELTNPIFPAFAQTIESGLAARGFTSVLCTQTPAGVHEDIYVQMLLDRGVAGIICISGQHADTGESVERYVHLLEQGVPLVLVNGYRPGVGAAFISSDDASAMQLAVTHLSELGHTRIGLAVGPRQYVPVMDKIAGFEAANAATGEATGLVAPGLFTVEGGAHATTCLVEQGATGIIFASDIMALGGMRQARRMRLPVPRDLSIIGYDDSPLMAFTDPPLTTLRQSVAEMSEAIVMALLEGIRGSQDEPPQMVFQPELVVRGSTARVPSAHSHRVSSVV